MRSEEALGAVMEVPANVFILAGYEPLRLGLGEVIRDSEGLRLVGTASSTEELLSSLDVLPGTVGVVDVETLALSAGGAAGQQLPFARIVFLRSKGDPLRPVLDYVSAREGLEALALVDKDGGALRLADTVRLVHQGSIVLPAELAGPLLQRYARLITTAADGHAEHLSERELEVARLVARGLSNKQIASELTVSEGTVKAHVSHILAKLGIAHRAELVGYILASDLSA